MKDIAMQIDFLHIDQILDEMSIIPRDLIITAFSRNQTPNKDLEHKFVRSLHVLHLSKIIRILKQPSFDDFGF